MPHLPEPDEDDWDEPADDQTAADRPAVDRADYQFSLKELLGLTALLAMILAGGRVLARCLPGGETVENLAGVMGIFSLTCMIALATIPFSRRIVLVGWWSLLGLYILTAAVALIQHK